MKRTLLLILVCIATMSTWASKAFPGFTTVQQKDGTMLTIQLIGNADFSYNVTTDGVILFHEGNDYFIAKIDENGEISSTGLLAHEQGLRSAEEIAAINAQDKGAFNNTTTKRMSRRKANVIPTSNPPFFPCTGSPSDEPAPCRSSLDGAYENRQMHRALKSRGQSGGAIASSSHRSRRTR